MNHLHSWLRGIGALFLLVIASMVQATTVTISSNQNWTAPAGVTTVTVEAWGGGGAGGGATGNPAKGGGGAGGQYASKVLTVVPSTAYVVVVGAGGSGSAGNGVGGGDSSFSTSVVAKGGAGGSVGSTNSGTAAAGAGSASSGVGTVVWAGGSGSDGSGAAAVGGAGGGGAGSGGIGGSASGDTAGTGTTSGGGDGAAARTSGGTCSNAAITSGGGGCGGYADGNNDRSGGAGAAGKVVISYGTVTVTSINTASFSPTQTNRSVSWTVVFNQGVTGVDAADFLMVQTGGVAGAAITAVTGGGTTWTVSAGTGTGTAGTLGLNLVDNDSITSGLSVLGGAGSANGNFTGQTYTVLVGICSGAADIIFCDDFERANPRAIGNGWTITPANAGNCTGATGNTGCAGIDSDIPPFSTYANPRANPSRSMFTRWATVSVDSPVISLAGKTGAQLSFWMRRGRDTFSECPEASGENYLVQYYASGGTWKILAQYPSSPTAALCDGRIFTPVIELPSDALHAGFKMRFYQPSGSGDNGGGTGGGALGVAGYDYWHMDDVVIREVSTPSFVGAFCDNFEAGLGRWSISAEGFTSGNIGDASIGTSVYQSANYELDMRWGYVTASTFKTNLVGVTGNITYWVRSGVNSTTDPVTNEDLVAEYLNSAGTWTALATYLGSVASGTTYSASVAIPADAKHANFRLRFRKVSGSGYDKSYWHVDDVCVGDLLPAADLSLSKTGSSTLVPGTNTNYTLRATNNGPAALSGSMQIVDTLPTGLSYVSASGTGWSCSANAQVVTCSWTGSLANGAVAPDVVLTAAIGASVTGSVTNTATLTGTVNDSVSANNTASFTSGNFIPAYIFTDGVCNNGVAIGQAGQSCSAFSWSTLVAGQSKTGIYLTAVNSSGVPTRLSSSASTAVGFEFGLSCIDPIANAGVQATFSATATALALCAGSGAQPTMWSSPSSLAFPSGSPSVATSYAFAYADVGQVELFMRNASATTQMGTSGGFVVKPAGFVLTGIKCTTADATNCGAGALVMTTPGDNPAATSASQMMPAPNATVPRTFIRAGHPFTVTATALTASGKAKADAGTTVNCTTTSTDCTPNFGREVSPESVKLTPVNSIAGMVTAPDVAGTFGSFSAGIATGIAFSWSEVGIITLAPTILDSDYLGVGDVAGASSGSVGRFYPHHFDTTLTQGCASAFTYSGQPFALRMVAYKAGGSGASGITANYGSGAGFSKITTMTAIGATGTFTGGDVTGSQFSASKFTGGVTPMLTTGSVLAPTFTFATSPSAPASAVIRATDTDGVSSSAGGEGANLIRSGRARMLNAYGSELLDLPVVFRTEYLASLPSDWRLNSLDACTDATLTFSAAGAPNITGFTCVIETGSNSGLTSCGASPVVANRAYLEGGMTGTDSGGVAGFAGNFNLWLRASGATHAGSLDITASVPAWLQYNWTGVVGNPKGRATFGVYRSPLIYRRENY